MTQKNLSGHSVDVIEGNIGEDTLWSFALKVYASASVEKQCLDIQNGYRGNVLIVLWLMWLQSRGIVIADDDRKLIIESINSRSECLLEPLREVRKSLKDCVSIDPATKKDVKRKILEAELSIEKSMIEEIQAQSQNSMVGLPLSPQICASQDLPLSTPLTRYLQSLSVADVELVINHLYQY